MTDYAALGLATRFRDAWGQERDVPEETLRALAAAIGGGDEAPVLDPVVVLLEGEHGGIGLRAHGETEWLLRLETGGERHGRAAVRDGRLPLPADLPLGYHTLELRHGTARIIVAPRRCHALEAGRFWALTCQLYSLRTPRGIGDFTALAELAEGAARAGAAAVGVNPLHALFAAEPRHISPYSPSSRLFLNPLYVDLGPVVSDEGAFVDYAAVAAAKRGAFERRFAHTDEFFKFEEDGGKALLDFCVFETLHEHALEQGWGWSWRHWPAPFRNPRSNEVARFAEEHRHRIELAQFRQFEADRQLGEAQRRARAAGMAIGLYRDLAVGVDPNGAEAWADQDLLTSGASIGAPPDLLNLKGQNWGLVPLSPVALCRRAYDPFIAALRANMRHAGALRIDHVMALRQLYWIPEGAPPDAGAYVRYPFEDLVRILCLESRRSRCAVVGEDLGTVPEGFRERMHDAGILSYRVLFFERGQDGGFLPPAHYPESAAATVSTHDIATLKGWWEARDIEWRDRLDLYPSEESRRAEHEARVRDRALLVDALRREGIEVDPADEDALCEAVHRFLARAPARLMLVQAEDVAGEVEQPNLPGTVDEHPNWRRRLSHSVEEMLAAPLFRRIAAAVNDERRRQP
jgi:4-alpha-glucanotransferase